MSAAADPGAQAGRRALITGITGQDGAYLARLLLGKGYVVAGTFRPTSSLSLWRLQELGIAEHPRLHLLEHDLTDLAGSFGLLEQAAPDEIYNLAAQSFVGLSFKQPVSTAQVTAMGALNLLEAVRIVAPRARFYQASSSEMFGGGAQTAQDESTPLRPRSPYAVAKCFAHMATINYREAYGLYAASGILFNHESPLRSPGFLTRKVSDAVARIHLGQLQSFRVGNIEAERDWGHAADYAEGIWRMLQSDHPDTYVLATGRSHSVRQFIDQAFAVLGHALEWRGQGSEARAVDARTGELRVQIDPGLYRPADLDRVVGDPGKARRQLGWQAGTDLAGLARSMVEADLARRQGSA